DRMLPVHASDDLVVTCVLEYERHTVKVHDLVWTRRPEGWRLQKSMYRKLRLAPRRVAARLAAAGFPVERHGAPGGLAALVGILRKTPPRGQRRHGRMASGRGRISGAAKTAR